MLTHVILTKQHEVGIIINTALQMRKPRKRKVKTLAQDHTATKWQSKLRLKQPTLASAFLPIRLHYLIVPKTSCTELMILT